MIGLAAGVSLAMMVLAVPIFLVFGVGSSVIALGPLHLPWTTLMQVSFDALTKNVLLAIPLFIFVGLVMLKGGTADRLVALCTALVGHWRGGLAISMILAMGFFAAFCGSILAGIIAVGTILMPRMIEKGYPRPFVVVLAASAGVLEGLIPPSNAAIIFSALTQAPVSQTFAAGLIPGLILMTMLMLYVFWRCRNLQPEARASWRERGQAFIAAIPALTTPVIIMGGIYLGLFTPSESAAVAAVWAILVGVAIYRQLTWSGLFEALRQTAITSTVIFAIIAMATFLSVVLTFTRAPQQIVELFIEYGTTPLMFLFIVGTICLILGTFLEGVPIMYLTIPVFIVVLGHIDLNILHFYIVFIAFVAIGMLTPPVCVGIYTASAVIQESPERAMREVPGFVGVFLLYALLMIFWSWPSTWLPRLIEN